MDSITGIRSINAPVSRGIVLSPPGIILSLHESYIPYWKNVITMATVSFTAAALWDLIRSLP